MSESHLPFRNDTFELNWEPFPHLLVDDFLEPDIFEALRSSFPALSGRDEGRPSECTLFWGDDQFTDLVEACPEWQTLADAINSQAFVDFSTRQFSPILEKFPCRLDLDSAHWVSYQEPREAKETDDLEPPDLEPDDVYCRIDLHRAYDGYRRRLHLDHLRRFVTMLIYFDDSDEIGMDGGELLLHDRFPELPLLHGLGMTQAPWSLGPLRMSWAKTTKVEPKRNRMVMFAPNRHAWHSVPTIRSTVEPRTFLQIRVSAPGPIWE